MSLAELTSENCLFLICPTDRIEPLLAKRFMGQAFFYTSLDACLEYQRRRLPDTEPLGQLVNNRKITYVSRLVYDEQASLYIFPIFIWFKDTSFVEASFTPSWQNVDFNFVPLGLETGQGNCQYTQSLPRYNTDQSKNFSESLSYDFGNFYNGGHDEVKSGVLFAPISQVTLPGDFEYRNINCVGVENRALDIQLYKERLRVALHPRVQFSTFYQYNCFDEQGRVNVRFSWQYMSLSFIYLVFNDTQINVLNPVQQSTPFISKITFLKQF